MFGSYSIETASRHHAPTPSPFQDTLYRIDSAQPSPCDETPTYRSAPFSVSQLSQEFSRQQLHCTSRSRARWSHTRHPSETDISSYVDEHGDSTSSSCQDSFFPRTPSPTRWRLQRQRNGRLLCDPSHLRSISELVDRMVKSEDQCAVAAPASLAISTTATPSSDDDEGYNSSDDSSPRSMSSTSSTGSRSSVHGSSSYGLQYRRSSEVFGDGACLAQNARVRKPTQKRRISRADL